MRNIHRKYFSHSLYFDVLLCIPTVFRIFEMDYFRHSEDFFKFFFSSRHSIDYCIDFFYFYRNCFSILSKESTSRENGKNARRNFLTKSSCFDHQPKSRKEAKMWAQIKEMHNNNEEMTSETMLFWKQWTR